LVAAASALLAMGCASQAVPRPLEPPLRAVQPHSEAAPRQVEEVPEPVAPPPAYGNKVVMARGLSASAVD
jgi:hypothetical protein